MKPTRISVLLPVLVLIGLPTNAFSRGAYELESQYSFPSPDTLSVVAPVADSTGAYWVLANNIETFECLFIGPFDRDDPPTATWRLPDNEQGAVPTQCISAEAGPEGGFFVRGFIVPDPLSTDPLFGFIAALDSELHLDWLVYDAQNLVSGIYGEPLPRIAWSPLRTRVLTFFVGLLDLGIDQVNQLHGMSIADGSGIVRRTITSWGDVSSGTLQGLLVMPEGGAFLVIAHANGTQFLVYDGVEQISVFPGGDTDWMQQSVDHAQFASNGNLFIVHHDRLDTGNFGAALTCLSPEGEVQYYSRNLARTLEIEDPESNQPVELTFYRPSLSFVTDSTVTLLRSAQVEYVLHIFDHFNGTELAIQPLNSIDEHQPTHLADAHSPDRLILMSYSVDGMSVTRYLGIIKFNPDLQTPGPYVDGEEPVEPDAPGRDSGSSDLPLSEGGMSDEHGLADNGCGCQVADRQASFWITFLILLSAVAFCRRPLIS
ncbi:MAG: hypothetical protein JW797_04640 [Bradymonadales bacterium]|nr:hypothetical protein [Bradymonadales bacterium]